MTINSYGFDSTVTEGPWATMAKMLGVESGFGQGAYAPSTSAVPYYINCAPGPAMSSGVLAISDAVVSVGPFDPVSSGSRWDVIVLRRNWTDNATTLIKINGPTGGAKTFPLLESSPGDVEDQLVAWVNWTAGSTVPVIEDLRTYASQVWRVPSLSVIRFPRLGMEAVTPDGRRWCYEVIAGAPQWRGDRSILSTPGQLSLVSGSSLLTPAAGWDIGSGATALVCQAIPLTGNLFQLDIELRRSASGVITANDNSGNFDDIVIAKLKAPFLPEHSVPCNMTYVGRTSSTAAEGNVGGTVSLRSNGDVVLADGKPGVNIYSRPAGKPSVQFSRIIGVRNPLYPNAV